MHSADLLFTQICGFHDIACGRCSLIQGKIEEINETTARGEQKMERARKQMLA